MARIAVEQASSNHLYYGDNLDVMRRKIEDETIDLCYIDPPFNSKRTYSQVYNNVGCEDKAGAQAFTDIWVWDSHASEGLDEILTNEAGRFQPRLIALIGGLTPVLGKGAILAYLVSLSLRVTEIHRVLKRSGSFYLHCDPTASHYVKMVLDSLFLPGGGEFQNEIVWSYQTGGASKRRFARKHDIIFFYTKSTVFTFNSGAIKEPRTEKSIKRAQNQTGARISATDIDKLPTDVFQIPALNPMATERLGYPTQKPEALLERIILASSDEGDLVLDAYCGCGTTAAVAQRLKRRWIGIDMSYQATALVSRRLEHAFGKAINKTISTDGISRDMKSKRYCNAAG